MRFVETKNLKEGMILGKCLLGKNGELLLGAGIKITERGITKIKEIGYNGVYIHDNFTKEVDIVEIISNELKTKTVKSIKNMYLDIERSGDTNKKNYDYIRKLIDDILDDILNNRNLMVNMVDLRLFDDYTFYHSLNVAVLSIIIGIECGLNKIELYELGLGALLHDVGKVFVDKDILNKNNKLTDVEMEKMKRHSEFGYEYLKDKFQLPPKSYVGVLQHHERWDGLGYPSGKKGDKISLFGRIISIADVYDALTSDRPYRKAMPTHEAMEYLMGGGGTLFDPELVSIFTKKVAPYPMGTLVKLSDGRLGAVVKNYEDCCVRPVIKIINPDRTCVYVDLKNDKDAMGITITDTIRI